AIREAAARAFGDRQPAPAAGASPAAASDHAARAAVRKPERPARTSNKSARRLNAPIAKRVPQRPGRAMARSWTESPEEEWRQLSASAIDELLEAVLVHAEQRLEHRPRRKRKDAERYEVDHELLRFDRPHGSGTNRGVELLAQLREDLRPDVLGR